MVKKKLVVGSLVVSSVLGGIVLSRMGGVEEVVSSSSSPIAARVSVHDAPTGSECNRFNVVCDPSFGIVLTGPFGHVGDQRWSWLYDYDDDSDVDLADYAHLQIEGTDSFPYPFCIITDE